MAVIEDTALRALRREALALLVASRLDEAMTHRAISQAELAMRAGIHRATVNQALKAANLMSLSTLERLAAALDCDIVVDLRQRTMPNSPG